jgi:hypothetical protein
MNPAPTVSVGEALARSSARSNPARLLYATFAVLLLVVTVLGFQQFYLHGQAYPGREILPPARLLIVAHGVAMSCWIILFLVQTLLIVGANRRLHMTLGKIGAVLAAGIVVLGWQVPIAVTRLGPEFPLWGLTRRQFMAIPMFVILIFGVFVAIGIWNRRRPEIHRPMMLLATMSIVAAATDRITAIHALYGESVWGRIFGPFFPVVVIGAAFLVLKWLLTRAFDRTYAVGYAALTVACAMIMWVAPTQAWVRFASFLVG